MPWESKHHGYIKPSEMEGWSSPNMGISCYIIQLLILVDHISHEISHYNISLSHPSEWWNPANLTMALVLLQFPSQVAQPVTQCWTNSKPIPRNDNNWYFKVCFDVPLQHFTSSSRGLSHVGLITPAVAGLSSFVATGAVKDLLRLAQFSGLMPSWYLVDVKINSNLVGGWALPLWKMMDFVSWDDDIPNWMEP